MFQNHRRNLSIAASLLCLVSFAATVANADVSSSANANSVNPKSVACAQHAVVGGIAHQPTNADIETGLAICGVSDPVDTSPAIGADVDELSDTLLGRAARSARTRADSPS